MVRQPNLENFIYIKRSVKTLDRQELDVTNKTRSNIFGWRGQFTSEFVGWDLREAVSRIISAQSL